MSEITEKMVDDGAKHYSEGGCYGLDYHKRREVVRDILEAAAVPALAAKDAELAALSDGWMKAKGELAAVEEQLSRQHERILQLQMLAWKWQEAHDCLKSGLPYSFPAPSDLPDAIAKIDRVEKIVESYVGGEYEAQGCAAEQILNDIRDLRQEACEYCGPGIYTGLPGGACENCMGTGLKYPARAALSEQRP